MNQEALNGSHLRTMASFGIISNHIINNKTQVQLPSLQKSIYWHDEFKWTLTCARSPSYLYSQENSISWNLLRTSETPVVGLASMGPMGTPTVNLQVSDKLRMPCCTIALMIFSYDGSTEYVFFIISSACTQPPIITLENYKLK